MWHTNTCLSLHFVSEDPLPVVEDKSKSVPRKMKPKEKQTDDIPVRDTSTETEKSLKKKKPKKTRKSRDSSKTEFYGKPDSLFMSSCDFSFFFYEIDRLSYNKWL